MGLLQRAQRPILPHPTIADQRTISGYEAQRRAYGSGRRLRIEILIPNAGILLYHRALESTLLVGRFQSCPQDPGRHRAQQESHVRACSGCTLRYLLLRGILIHDDAPIRRRDPHVQPHPHLRLAHQELAEERAVRLHF